MTKHSNAMLSPWSRKGHKVTDAARRLGINPNLIYRYGARLDEKASIDGFVRHPQALVVGVGSFEPAADLFGRPVLSQFRGPYTSQPAVQRKATGLGATGPIPSLLRG